MKNNYHTSFQDPISSNTPVLTESHWLFSYYWLRKLANWFISYKERHIKTSKMTLSANFLSLRMKSMLKSASTVVTASYMQQPTLTCDGKLYTSGTLL